MCNGMPTLPTSGAVQSTCTHVHLRSQWRPYIGEGTKVWTWWHVQPMKPRARCIKEKNLTAGIAASKPDGDFQQFWSTYWSVFAALYGDSLLSRYQAIRWVLNGKNTIKIIFGMKICVQCTLSFPMCTLKKLVENDLPSCHPAALVCHQFHQEWTHPWSHGGEEQGIPCRSTSPRPVRTDLQYRLVLLDAGRNEAEFVCSSAQPMTKKLHGATYQHNNHIMYKSKSSILKANSSWT